MVFARPGPFTRTGDMKTVPLRAAMVGGRLATNGDPTSQPSHLLRAPDLTAELPARATKGRQAESRARFSGHEARPAAKQWLALAGEGAQPGASGHQIHTSLDLGKDRQHEILPSSLCQPLPGSLGSCLQAPEQVRCLGGSPDPVERENPIFLLAFAVNSWLRPRSL